jgi:hypothetical protein
VANESPVLVKVYLLIFATKRMPPLFPTGILFFIHSFGSSKAIFMIAKA